MNGGQPLHVESIDDGWRVAVAGGAGSHIVSPDPETWELRCDCDGFVRLGDCPHCNAVDRFVILAPASVQRPGWFERLHHFIREDAIHDTRQQESDDPLPRLADDVLRALAHIEELERRLAIARGIRRP